MSRLEDTEINKSVEYIKAGKSESDYTLISLHRTSAVARVSSMSARMASSRCMDLIQNGKYCIITNKGNTILSLNRYLKGNSWSNIWVGSMYCINKKMNENIIDYGEVHASVLLSGIEWFKYWIFDIESGCYDVTINYTDKCTWFTNDNVLVNKRVDNELQAKCETIKGLLRLKVIENNAP